MVMYWNEKAATILGSPRTQPIRTRLFAMVQIAVHDALNNIKPKFERYAFHEREQHAHPDAAVASAAYWAIKGLNVQGSFPIDTWYNEALSTVPDGESKELGKTLGKKSPDAIIANRTNDGFAQANVNSVIPANGINPGEYRSTLMYANGILIQVPFRNIPNWGTTMKPYVVEGNSQFRPGSPYAVNSDSYTADYNEVKTKGARIGGFRTAEEEKAGKFWSENRPSVIWNLIARKAIENKKLDAWKTARLFALIHVSIAESINSQLNASYHYYFWRPETAVRLGDTDGNNITVGDANWLPALDEVPNVFPTPPVPGYPNGFAAYAGASAEILKLFFGSDETSIDVTTTSLNPALTEPRPSFHFLSFSKAARDNSLSMIYNGWDFRKSILEGEEMGRRIGNYVFNHAFREE